MKRIYERLVLPHAVDYTCSRRPQLRQRAKVVPAAAGVVLEIGFGTGLNLPWYDATRVERILALDPSDAMWRRAARRVERSPIPVERIAASAEDVPLAPASIDCAVSTYTLCTIPDAGAALAAIRRALRPGGRLLFCEHGAAPDEAVRRWQDRLDRLWGHVSGGCHLNRPIPRLLEAAGFRLAELDEAYLPGWRVASYNFWGVARPE
jgi:ubiquinone/menaquinone biosynthesis C-methylase UbiE